MCFLIRLSSKYRASLSFWTITKSTHCAWETISCFQTDHGEKYWDTLFCRLFAFHIYKIFQVLSLKKYTHAWFGICDIFIWLIVINLLLINKNMKSFCKYLKKSDAFCTYQYFQKLHFFCTYQYFILRDEGLQKALLFLHLPVLQKALLFLTNKKIWVKS